MNKVELMILSIAEEIGFVLVKVLFKNGTQQYTYKALSDEGIVAGDSVVVNSPRDGLVCVEVQEVLDSSAIDMNAPFTYQWIVQKVKTERYKETLEREAKIRKVLQNAELRKARAEAVEAFKLSLGQDVLVQVYEVAGIKKVKNES